VLVPIIISLILVCYVSSFLKLLLVLELLLLLVFFPLSSTLLKVREARSFFVFWSMWSVSASVVCLKWFKSVCTRIWMNCMDVLGCFWCCVRETVGENWYSRPSELISPRRELQKLAQVLLDHLAQAESSCSERRIILLRRERLAQANPREKPGVLCLSPRSGERFLV